MIKMFLTVTCLNNKQCQAMDSLMDSSIR